MNNIVLLLCFVIFITDVMKLSMMPKAAAAAWCVFWISLAYFVTLKLTGLSASEAQEYCTFKNRIVFGVIDILLIMSSIFNKGKIAHVLSYYPGFMLLLPVSMLAYGLSRQVSRADFYVLGIIAAGVSALILLGGFMLFRWLKADSAWLYVSALLNFILYILIYGIL